MKISFRRWDQRPVGNITNGNRARRCGLNSADPGWCLMTNFFNGYEAGVSIKARNLLSKQLPAFLERPYNVHSQLSLTL
jgi:hypothetical protein